MKTKLLRLLSFLGLILAALASLDLSGFTALLPPAHAGKSGLTCFALNHCSLGIELANAGADDELAREWSELPPTIAKHKNGGPVRAWETYPAAQLAACEALARVLVARYRLDDVIGHDDIAPARKNDPGPAFPMAALRHACGFPPATA